MELHKEDIDTTLQETIQECFFLKPNTDITSEMIRHFKEGTASRHFQQLSLHTVNHHTDQFAVHISHDIDWLDPHHPYAIINAFRSGVSRHQWFSIKQLWQKDLFLRNIEQLLSLEKEFAIRAIYCVGATTGTQLGRYDIRYSTQNNLYRELINMLNSHQQTFALHASCGAGQPSQLQKEIQSLSLFTAAPISINRSHYLKHTSPEFYTLLAQNGIRYDLGYGNTGRIGFSNHFPGKYKPVHTTTFKPINITLIPLILSDNIFFQKPYHEVMSAFRQTIQMLKQYNGSACILFHPENMLLKPQLFSYFEEIIHICRQEGAVLNPSLT